MKYFGISDKNVAAIFQLQWKIGNISDIFLQYSVICGISMNFCKLRCYYKKLSYNWMTLYMLFLLKKAFNVLSGQWKKSENGKRYSYLEGWGIPMKK